MASLNLHDRGIHHLEDVPLSISEAVGGGASSGTTVVVRLALPFNALTSIAPLPVLVASNSRENSLPPASREEDDGHGQSENYDSNANKSKGCGSKLPTPVVLAPLFLHLTLLDVRHNKLKSLHGVSALPSLKSLLACGNRNITSLEPLLTPAETASSNDPAAPVLPCLEALWLTGCGLVTTELARLLDAAPLPPLLQAGAPQLPVPQPSDNHAIKNRTSSPAKTHPPPVLVPSKPFAPSGSVATALPSGRVGFRSSLRVLAVKGCPLRANPSCAAILSLTFPELAFLDGRSVVPPSAAHGAAVTWAHSLDGNLAIHRLRHARTLQQEDSNKRAKRHPSSSISSGRGNGNTTRRSNRGGSSSSSNSSNCGGGKGTFGSGTDETRPQGNMQSFREGLISLDERATTAGSSADGEEDGVELGEARTRRRGGEAEEENSVADGTALTARAEQADAVADLGVDAATADEDQSATRAAAEAGDDANALRGKEVTLANCMDDLSSELEQMLGLPPKRKPKAMVGAAAHKNKLSTTAKRTSSSHLSSPNDTHKGGRQGAGENGASGNEVASSEANEQGDDNGSGGAPSTMRRAMSAAVTSLMAAAPCTVHYARHSNKAGRRATAAALDAQQPIVIPLATDAAGNSSSSNSGSSSNSTGYASEKQQPQQQLGPQAVSIRLDGSCTVKWLSGSTAVCLERSSSSSVPSSSSPASFTLSAFFDNGGGLAVMLDARGYGSANYLNGATSLTCSPSTTGSGSSGGIVGFARSPSGDLLAEWKGSSPSSSSDASSSISDSKSNSGGGRREGEVQLDLGGGLGLIYAPPNETNGGGSGGGTLFFQHRGVKLALSQEAMCAAFLSPTSDLFGIEPGSSTTSGAGHGSRSKAKEAKNLPPLTHSDLIEQLRAATAGL